MKKILCLFLAILMLGLTLAACGIEKKVPDAQRKSDSALGSSTTDNSMNIIKEKGKIVIGLDDTFPPLGFRDEKNEIVGFDIDMARAASEIMGVGIEFKPIVWDNKMLELNGNNIDLIWNGFSVTPERQKEVLFSNPYLGNKQIVVVLNKSEIKTKADLSGKKVGLQGGSSAEDALKKDKATYDSIGDNKLMSYKDNVTALMDLEAGRIEAVVMDEVVARYQMSKKPNTYKMLEESFDEEVYAVGARINDKALIAEVNNALQKMKENGKAAEISNKWFGQNIVK